MKKTRLDVEYIKLLKAVENAHFDLISFYHDRQDHPDAEYHVVGMKAFPFDTSFDEVALREWIEASMDELNVSLTPELKTVEDVERWFYYLFYQGYNLHPDDSFRDFVNVDPYIAGRLDALMEIAHGICAGAGVDINGIALDCFNDYFQTSKI